IKNEFRSTEKTILIEAGGFLFRTCFSGARHSTAFNLSNISARTPKAFTNSSPGLRAPARYSGTVRHKSFATLKGLPNVFPTAMGIRKSTQPFQGCYKTVVELPRVARWRAQPWAGIYERLRRFSTTSQTHQPANHRIGRHTNPRAPRLII